ncbi:G-type lectin S-receptor-like serine/threonine-protein kinase RKS1 [Rhododendron vialii]|uniref:G-type lectin S-receptor-like serine/threonine-protein kinase RKS1 n=1 Tax=Rhododendron vialii TaxID=182163 RepID=UPI0026604B99|nr:G-type lectin S-receptor-like serine/threonine-protein kinase RKS1 [Rhododendron vialii]
MNPKKWVFILILPFLFFRFCTSIDTITPTQPIRDGNLVVSSGETFALGFFSPGNSSQRYVGIWYNKISERTVVWVANRDDPINGTTGVLSFNQNGNLEIYDNTRNLPVWDTNITAGSYSARLLDSGNLVLFQGDSGSGGVVWQSFDHPTNTMLPNMKLGLDRTTGREWFLTTWKSRDDPGTGEYSYRVEPNELPQLIMLKGSTRVWRISPWLARHSSDKPEVTPSFLFNGTYVNNRDEVYTFYTLINTSNVSTLFVDELGSLKMVTWVGRWVEFYSVPKDQCDYYGRCGVYGYCDSNNGREFECTCLPGYEPRSAEEWYLRDASGGCIKKHEALSMCGNGEGFVKVANVKIPDTSKAHVQMSLSVQECKEECLGNCSCLAFTNEAKGAAMANCFTWHENLMDVRRFPNGGMDLYVRVDAVELAQHMESRRLNGKMVAVVVTSVVLTSVLIITLVCWLVMKKRRRGKDIQESDDENVELPIFDMVTIAGATNNFSETNKIGEGGFGSVYKGHLSTGKDIAVKRLSTDSKQGLKEFKNEVILIANRDDQINRTTGVLSLNQNGNLEIYENTRNLTMWHTNITAGSYSAQLLDSGNLVLFQGDSGSGGGVWQSFDHPTNTQLPNMKLGLDRKTGLKRLLTTWKSRDDPGMGEYSYWVEPSELPQLVMFKGSTRVWRMPSWLAPKNWVFNGTYFNNRDEVSMFYTLIKASKVSTLFVDELGSLKMVTWVGRWVDYYSCPQDNCNDYGRCGVYGYCDSNNGGEFECTCLPGYEPRSTEEWYLRDASGGCIKKRDALSMCGNGEGFVKVANAKIPDMSKARVWMSLSVHECQDECLRKCTCLAYASEAEGGRRANCITWYENLMDVRRIPNGGNRLLCTG